MNGLNRFVQTFFLRTISPVHFSWFRFLFCVGSFIQLLLDYRVYNWGSEFDQFLFSPIPLFKLFRLTSCAPLWVSIGYHSFLVILLTIALGIRVRLPAFLAWVLALWVFGANLSMEKPIATYYGYHSKNVAIFVLFLLFAAPASANVSAFQLFRRQAFANSTPVWPLALIRITVALAYFGSAYQKMVTAGLRWMNGETLQVYLYEHYLVLDKEMTLWLASQYWLCLVLSIAVIVIESTFVFFVLSPTVAIIYAALAFAMHASIYYFLGIDFISYHTLSFIVFFVGGFGPPFAIKAKAPRNYKINYTSKRSENVVA